MPSAVYILVTMNSITSSTLNQNLNLVDGILCSSLNVAIHMNSFGAFFVYVTSIETLQKSGSVPVPQLFYAL